MYKLNLKKNLFLGSSEQLTDHLTRMTKVKLL